MTLLILAVASIIDFSIVSILVSLASYLKLKPVIFENGKNVINKNNFNLSHYTWNFIVFINSMPWSL